MYVCMHVHMHVCMYICVYVLEWSKIQKFLRLALHNPSFVLCMPTITSTKFDRDWLIFRGHSRSRCFHHINHEIGNLHLRATTQFELNCNMYCCNKNRRRFQSVPFG